MLVTVMAKETTETENSWKKLFEKMYFSQLFVWNVVLLMKVTIFQMLTETEWIKLK